MINRIHSGIDSLLKDGCTNFVIYPFGKWGKETKKILNDEYKIKEKYVVDKKHDNDLIIDINKMKADYQTDDFIILVAVDPDNFDTSLEIHRELMQFATLDRIKDLLAWSPFLAPYTHFDRICSRRLEKISPIECCAREIYYNGIKGNVAEAGVYKGETAKYINLLFPDRNLYLFDTFSGFAEKDQASDDNKNLKNLKYDFSKTSPKLVLGKMHFERKCIIKQGWFPQSANDIDKSERFSFVRLDMDLYDPIYAGLEFFYPRMSKGGVPACP